jgi:Icc-related predicted phosphoesterase
MRLLFVSDLHYSLKQFDWLKERARDFDAVIIGGDLLDLGSGLDSDVQITIVEKYLRLLREVTPVAISSGNHDGDSRNAADESIAAWMQALRADGVHVDGDSFDLGDTHITLCPWWDGQLSRDEIAVQLKREAAHAPGRWIWIHHSPPLGSKTSWTGKKFIGDEFLRAWIERYQPDLVLSGHIHNSPFYDEGSWIDQIGKTWVMNPGRQIGPQPSTITLDLAYWTAEWQCATDRSRRDLRIAQG